MLGKNMQAIKEARKYIEKFSTDPSAEVLARFVLALENETSFPITDIYLLDYDRFDLALRILKEWRLDRYYAGKGKLFDLSMQITQMKQEK